MKEEMTEISDDNSKGEEKEQELNLLSEEEKEDDETEYEEDGAVPPSGVRKRKVKIHLHRNPQLDNESIENSPYFRIHNGVVDIYPPWKEIIRAVIFLVAGAVLLCFARLVQTGKLNAEPGSDIALYVIGSLLFLPGLYVVIIAYKAWRGYPGYTFDSIPHD